MIVEALKATKGQTKDKVALTKALQAVSFNGPRGPLKIDPATTKVVQNMYVFEAKKAADGKGAGGGVALAVLAPLPAVQDAPNGCQMNF